MRIIFQVVVTVAMMVAMYRLGDKFFGDWVRERDLMSSFLGSILVLTPFALVMTLIEVSFERLWPSERND